MIGRLKATEAILLGILLIGGCGLTIYGTIWFLNNRVGPVVDAGENFMAAVHTGDWEGAYALLTPELQGTVSADALRNEFANLQIAGWSFSERSNKNGDGRLEGNLTLVNTAIQNLILHLQKVDGDWRVAYYEHKFPDS